MFGVCQQAEATTELFNLLPCLQVLGGSRAPVGDVCPDFLRLLRVLQGQNPLNRLLDNVGRKVISDMAAPWRFLCLHQWSLSNAK